MKKRKEKRKYVARPGIEPRTPDLRVRCPTDCATRPGLGSVFFRKSSRLTGKNSFLKIHVVAPFQKEWKSYKNSQNVVAHQSAHSGFSLTPYLESFIPTFGLGTPIFPRISSNLHCGTPTFSKRCLWDSYFQDPSENPDTVTIVKPKNQIGSLAANTNDNWGKKYLCLTFASCRWDKNYRVASPEIT